MGTSARPRIKEVNAAAVAHVGVKMSKKYYTENIKKVHEQYLRNYPSFLPEPTSNKQSTSEQTLKHSGPRYASNGRASKSLSQ